MRKSMTIKTLVTSKNCIIGIGVRGSVLASTIADSPIVDQQGSSTQWVGGVGLDYALWVELPCEGTFKKRDNA